MDRSLRLSDDLFPEEREKFVLNMGVRGGKSFFTIDVANDGFDAGGVSKGAEELVRCQMCEPNTIHTTAFSEDKLTGEKCEDGISDPGSFAFDFQRFVFGHRRMLKSGNRSCESFHSLLTDFSAQPVLRLGIPVSRLKLEEYR